MAAKKRDFVILISMQIAARIPKMFRHLSVDAMKLSYSS